MTAPTALAASTLTAPPGRSTEAIAAIAAAGESTYSSTLWHRTRSAFFSPATVGQVGRVPLDGAQRHPRLRGPPLRGGQRVRARVDDRHGVALAGQRHGEPAGAAARVDDVKLRPPGLRHQRRDHGLQHVAHNGGPCHAVLRIAGPLSPLTVVSAADNSAAPGRPAPRPAANLAIMEFPSASEGTSRRWL